MKKSAKKVVTVYTDETVKNYYSILVPLKTEVELSYTNPLTGITATIGQGTSLALNVQEHLDGSGWEIEDGKSYVHFVASENRAHSECVSNIEYDNYENKHYQFIPYTDREAELAAELALGVLLMNATNFDRGEGTSFLDLERARKWYKQFGVTLEASHEAH